jgi:hypothetical protein
MEGTSTNNLILTTEATDLLRWIHKHGSWPVCEGMAVDGGGHLKSCQWITPEMMLLTRVQIHYLHLNYIYYIRLVCALL